MRGGRHGGSTVFHNPRFRPGPPLDERPTKVEADAQGGTAIYGLYRYVPL